MGFGPGMSNSLSFVVWFPNVKCVWEKIALNHVKNVFGVAADVMIFSCSVVSMEYTDSLSASDM